ncbi:MAG: hypothetical protein ABJ205_04580 [Erythrobacter sp.]|uniref:hypothetical protein n=1 Tax=Erythrobacter sp. TaxID=1042 RepID=UPI00326433BD
MNSFRLFACLALLGGASCSEPVPENSIPLSGASPHLLLLVGDQDEQDEDFITILNVDPASEQRGQPLGSTPIGYKASMVHHMEYEAPPKGEPIFMNGHHHEMTFIVDISDPNAPVIASTFGAPSPLRFPHDYARTAQGTRLVGFLRSSGESPDPNETTNPGDHGGIAEYSMTGELIRTASAEAPGYAKAIRPYSFAQLPEMDRISVTSAPMMEQSWAEVVQIYRYSDFELLHTLDLKVGVDHAGNPVEGLNGASFGQHVLDDGSVFLNSYGCNFYHLSAIDSDKPQLDLVYSLPTDPAKNPTQIRGACGVPLLIGQYWVQPIGKKQQVVVLDISNPKSPKEVFRLDTPEGFAPHWMGKDPAGNRLIMGAELGGEQGFYMLRFDESTGRIEFDSEFADYTSDSLLNVFRSKSPGYISLDRKAWPHGATGPAWGHAAVFFDAG